jgi:MEMO1 family protein
VRSAPSESVRTPAVAGTFYPAQIRGLKDMIDQSSPAGLTRERAVAAILPHAGYTDCGSVLGSLHAQLAWTGPAVIIGPAHAQGAEPFHLMRKGQWETPLGKISVSEPLAEAILKEVPELQDNPQVQKDEHSIEVQLPFLQRHWGLQGNRRKLQFVPILLGKGDWELAQKTGLGIARAVEQLGTEALLVASTDLTHYQPREKAQIQDRQLIERIVALDAEGLLNSVEQENFSMCGAVPVAVVMTAAKALGANRAVLIQYKTSGESTGDFSSVVGFAGILIR